MRNLLLLTTAQTGPWITLIGLVGLEVLAALEVVDLQQQFGRHRIGLGDLGQIVALHRRCSCHRGDRP